MRYALAIDDEDGDTRLFLSPSRSADLLESVTIVRDDGSELAIRGRHSGLARRGWQHLDVLNEDFRRLNAKRRNACWTTRCD